MTISLDTQSGTIDVPILTNTELSNRVEVCIHKLHSLEQSYARQEITQPRMAYEKNILLDELSVLITAQEALKRS